MKIKKKFVIGILTSLFLLLAFIPKTYAHFLWLNVDDYTPKKGQEVRITLGWGHKFPETPTPPREEMIKKLSLFLIDPDGQKIPLNIPVKDGKPQPVKVKVTKNGIYLAVAIAKHFVSKTTEGYFYKSRDELKDKEIIYSKWSETTAIAIISVGKSKKFDIPNNLDSNFYILPLVNPSVLKEGETFQVKAIFYGKPYRTWVYATYAGFSKFKDTYAWATKTDKRGIANIKILKSGVNWLLKSEVEEHYPDPKKADIASYKCSVTFGF